MQKQVQAASLALIAEGSVLLIKRAFTPYAGYWTLPGGKLKPGETPEQAVRREVSEELSLMPGAVFPVRQFEMSKALPYVLAVFAAHATNQAPQPSSEIADWGWFQMAELSNLQVTPGLAEIVAQSMRVLHRGNEI